MTLRGNLSTRPFYNQRLVQVLLGLTALLLAIVTVFSAAQFLSLSREQGELSARIAVDEQRAEALQRDAATVRRGINTAELQSTVAATREVNRAIDQRVFSWTALFNTIEQTIPPAVTLQAVYPTIEDTGATTVRMVVNARRIDDVGAFMDNLERAQTFRDLQTVEEQRMDDGMLIVTFDGSYIGHGQLAAATPPDGSVVPAGPVSAAPVPSTGVTEAARR